MRLWASCDTITFDELRPRRGAAVEVFFGLSLAYIHRLGESRRNWPCDLAELGSRGLIQLPEFGAAFTALTGLLSKIEGERVAWSIESIVAVRLARAKGTGFSFDIDRVSGGEDRPCQALGQLSIVGRELAPNGPFTTVRLHGFRSFCLRSHDPRFGTWYDVDRYSDLGADPDVIAAPVLVADLELLSVEPS